MKSWSPLALYACAFAAAAAGGLAVYLRSDKPITVRAMLSETIYHGLLGAGLGAILHEWRFKEKPATVVAVAALYGVGVLTVAEFKAALLRALNFNQSRNNDDRKP